MPPKERPPLQNFDDEEDAMRRYGEERGMLPTAPAAARQADPPVEGRVGGRRTASPEPEVRVVYARPAPTRSWQGVFPGYLVDELKKKSAETGKLQKVLVMEALRAAGFRVDDIDLQDLRKR